MINGSAIFVMVGVKFQYTLVGFGSLAHGKSGVINMLKKVTTTRTIIQKMPFCDICGEEIPAWSFNDYDEPQTCSICGRDLCQKCIIYDDEIQLYTNPQNKAIYCPECYEEVKGLIANYKMAWNAFKYNARDLVDKKNKISEETHAKYGNEW